MNQRIIKLNQLLPDEIKELLQPYTNKTSNTSNNKKAK